MGIPLDKAELLALFLETFLYGLFFTLFWIMVLVLYHPGRPRHTQRRALIPVGAVMLALATVHLVIDFVRVLKAFSHQDHSALPHVAIDYYSNMADPLHIAKTVFYVSQTLLGDGVIVWRLFIVYNRNWYITAPALLLLVGNACTGYVGTWTFTHADPTDSIFQHSRSWITSFFVLTMAVNGFCTVAISYRIYSTHRGLETTKTLLPVTIAIIESGALYATGVLSLLVAYLAKSNGQYPALDSLTPLVGIVFSLIVLQIYFHLGKPPPIAIDAINGDHWRRASVNVSELGYNMNPVAVHITEHSQVGYPGSDKRPDSRSEY